MKIPLLVFGTRPEYLKLKPLVKIFEKESIDFIFLQVLQHQDLTIEEASKPYYRSVSFDSKSDFERLTILTSEIPKAVESYVKQASYLFIQGDTATAFLTALCAFHLHVPIFHIEAGLRTYDLENPFPEEAYRSMISRIATFHLCPDESSKVNLQKEGITKNIFVIGNTILDLVKSYKIPSQIGSIVPITVHRRENWEQLSHIVKSIHKIAKAKPELTFLWIYHPNPSLQTRVNNIIKELESLPNIQFLQPCSHEALCKYLHDAKCIITDSGGIQEEASFLGKYCFVLRKVTERSSIPATHIEMISNSVELYTRFLEKTIIELPPCTVYGDGHACEKIVTLLRNLNQ